MPVLTPVQGSVSAAGETVTLALGSSKWNFHYETAFLLAHWMKKSARQARPINSFSQTHGLATLHDAEKGPDFGQPYTPNGLYQVKKDLVPKDRIAVGINGQLVVVRLGNDEFKLPWIGADRMAQWLRLRAKDCKRRAGDLQRHWSQIANQHADNYA
jgi:hypothetical protein